VLRAAVEGYDAALAMLTREARPAQWAMTQHNRAYALQSLGDLTRDAAVLRAAIQGYNVALTVRTREAAPAQWSETLNNRAGTLVRLSALSDDAAALREAVDGLNAALAAFTREAMPAQWATMQQNRASTLRRLGNLSGDAAVLRAAIEGYDTALTVLTRETTPANWAMTQTNLANTLLNLGDLLGDTAILRVAVAGCDAALTVRTREAMPRDWAATHNTRANTLASLGGLLVDATVLRTAVEGYDKALTVHTRDAMPADWAMTQMNRANALASLGRLLVDETVLRAAVEGYDKALTVHTRDAMPADWAGTQHNRANVLASLADLGDNAGLTKAITAYRVALAVMAGSGAEDIHQGTAGALARLLVRQARQAGIASAAQATYAEAAAVIGQALERSDAALLDAGRSPDGRQRAIERVDNLYGLLSLCRHHLGETAAALAAAESGRTRLAVETLSLSRTRAAVLNDPEARAAVEAAEQHRASLVWQLGHGGGRAAEAARASLSADQRSMLETALQDATETVLALHRRYKLMPEIEPLSAEAIIAAAPADGALVLPVIAAGEAFAFVIANGTVQTVPLKDAEDKSLIDERMLRRRVVNDPNSWLRTYYSVLGEMLHERQLGRDHKLYHRWTDYVQETLNWLWDVLLGPLDAHLRDPGKANLQAGAPVVLLPPGLLGVLPLLGAAPTPGDVPFGERWTVSLAPSVRTLLDCRDRARNPAARPQRLLSIIDPDHSLRGARLEARELARLFRHGEPPDMLVGDEATRAAVLALLDWPTHLHASTHGHHHPIDPTQSGLLLAGKEELRLGDLRAAQLAGTRLVFLSACETGLAGVLKLSEEFIGLAAGFVAAGAAGVVASLWPVFDDTSYLLTVRFYKELLDQDGNERQPPAAALRAAQSWLRTVTYGELQRDYEVAAVGKDRFLLIGQRRSTPTTAAPARAAPGLLQRWFRGIRSGGGVGHPPTIAEDDTPQPIRLRLDADYERPFASPHEWAAFTATGA